MYPFGILLPEKSIFLLGSLSLTLVSVLTVPRHAQVGGILSARAQETAATLGARAPPPAPPALTLDADPVLRAVRAMNFVECIREFT